MEPGMGLWAQADLSFLSRSFASDATDKSPLPGRRMTGYGCTGPPPRETAYFVTIRTKVPSAICSTTHPLNCVPGATWKTL